MIILPIVTVNVADFYQVEGFERTNATDGFSTWVSGIQDWYTTFSFGPIVASILSLGFLPVIILVLIFLDFIAGPIFNPLYAFGNDFANSLVIFTIAGIPSWVTTGLILIVVGIPIIILISKLPAFGSG